MNAVGPRTACSLASLQLTELRQSDVLTYTGANKYMKTQERKCGTEYWNIDIGLCRFKCDC